MLYNQNSSLFPLYIFNLEDIASAHYYKVASTYITIFTHENLTNRRSLTLLVSVRFTDGITSLQ